MNSKNNIMEFQTLLRVMLREVGGNTKGLRPYPNPITKHSVFYNTLRDAVAFVGRSSGPPFGGTPAELRHFTRYVRYGDVTKLTVVLVKWGMTRTFC